MVLCRAAGEGEPCLLTVLTVCDHLRHESSRSEANCGGEAKV